MDFAARLVWYRLDQYAFRNFSLEDYHYFVVHVRNRIKRAERMML